MKHEAGIERTADARRGPAMDTQLPWRGVCSCGWKGDGKTKKAQAQTEATQHLRAVARRA